VAIKTNLTITAKAVKKKAPKKRAEKYDEKVTVTGSFEDMVKISTTGAGLKKRRKKEIMLCI
jgi:hypothetical protein